MMKLISILLGLSLFSCATSSSKRENKKKSTVAPQEADITHASLLPFGPAVTKAEEICTTNSKFYAALIGEGLAKEQPEYTASFDLPSIESFNYISVDSTSDRLACEDNTPINELFKINKYKVQLPNLGDLRVYYSTGAYQHAPNYLQDHKEICSNFIYDYYGFLTLYDEVKNSADVFCVFYDDYQDGQNARRFFIDKDYNVFVCNIQYAEGENGVDRIIGSKINIKLSKDQKHQISQIE